MPRWSSIIAVLLIVGCTANGKLPSSEPLPRPGDGPVQLGIYTRFTVEKATQIMSFVVSKDAVYASIRYTGPLITDPRIRSQRPWMTHERHSAVVAWRPDGELLWQADYPEARYLALADDKLVLAYNSGWLYSKKGIIWIDRVTGQEAHRTEFGGRTELGGSPLNLTYYPKVQLVVMLRISPECGLHGLNDVWMEVVAYKSNGTLAWQWKHECRDLYALRIDGEALVVGTTYSEKPLIVRLDPRTGQEMWRVPWNSRKPIKQNEGENAPDSHESLVMVPMRYGVSFLDMASGKTVTSFPLPELSFRHIRSFLPRPKVSFRQIWRVQHYDRVYITSNDVKGITIAAYHFPSGRVLWADETGTVSRGGPVAWRENVVFLARGRGESRSPLGFGTVTLIELRVYGPKGRLLAKIAHNPQEKSEFFLNDTVRAQAVGERLYVASRNAVMAMRWKTVPAEAAKE